MHRRHQACILGSILDIKSLGLGACPSVSGMTPAHELQECIRAIIFTSMTWPSEAGNVHVLPHIMGDGEDPFRYFHAGELQLK